MKSRAARLTLLILFIVSLGATAYLFWNGEALAGSQSVALRTFEEKARITTRALLDTRAAQQAYVAAGQAGEYWPGQVDEGMNAVRSGLAALRAGASSAEAATELEAAAATLDDFAQLNRRAREYARTGQNRLASDLIFGDGLAMTTAIDARLEEARAAEIAERDEAAATFRSRQGFALTAGAAAASLVVLLLLPGAESSLQESGGIAIAPREVSTAGAGAAAAAAALRAADRPPPRSPGDRFSGAGGSAEAADPGDLEIVPEGWSPPSPLKTPDQLERSQEPVLTAPATPVSDSVEVVQAAHPATDLGGLASLCTDLARVIDTHQLPSLLDRASTVLDARGIILWIADPDGRELNPIVVHGYPAQLVNRLGTIDRDAENATAAAFRTSLLQTVNADAQSNGAIVAPLVTPAGCVGVMAAEVRPNGQREESRLAAAAIVAAQLATLVGPPARNQSKVEVAGA